MRRSGRRTGFTLIELLLATALAALLMGGVLLIVSQLTREASRLTGRRDNHEAVSDRLVEFIRLDLARGRELHHRRSDGAVRITGYGSIDPNTGRPTGKACDVTYRLVKSAGGTSLLLRDQSLQGDPTRRTWSVLLATNVRGFIVEPIVRATANPTTSPTTNESTVRPTLPDSVRLVVRWTTREVEPVDRTLILR